MIEGLANDNLNSTSGAMSIPDVFRFIGFILAKGLAVIVDGLYSGINQIISNIGFANSKNVISLVNKYHDLLLGILIISIACLGLFLIKNAGKREGNIIENIFICVLIISSFPFITAKFTAYTSSAAKYIVSEGYSENAVKQNFVNATGKGSIGTKGKAISGVIVASNIVDLQMVKEKGSNSICWRDKKGNPKGYIDGGTILGKNWQSIDINAKMEQNSPYNQKWAGGEIKELDSGIFGMFQDKYYRYQVISWLSILLELTLLVVILGFAIIKEGRLLFEMGMAQIYTPFIAATDLAVGQRLKEAVKNFISLFATFLLCLALLGIYFVGFTWVEQTFSNVILRITMQLALAWAIIDGPDVLERILGIDVGVKSGYKMLLGVFAAQKVGKGVYQAGKGGYKAGKGMYQGVKSGVAFAKNAKNTLNVTKNGNAEDAKDINLSSSDGRNPLKDERDNSNLGNTKENATNSMAKNVKHLKDKNKSVFSDMNKSRTNLYSESKKHRKK